MGIGIAVMGLNGCGKSTLAHALAKELRLFEMDVEDYYFPEQKLHRRAALEGRPVPAAAHLGDLPFSVAREKAEVEKLLLQDLLAHPDFIISGVTMNWSREITARIRMAFLLTAPARERLERIRQREYARFGARVLAGGDMYEQQRAFREMAASRTEDHAAASAEKLGCPLYPLDGRKPVSENLAAMLEIIRSHS